MSSCRAATSNDLEANGFVEFVVDGWRVVQGSVATESFHGSSERRYDIVLVSGKMERNRSEKSCNPEKISAWFRIALAFLSVALDALENGLCKGIRRSS